MADQPTKFCRKCKIEKSLTEFFHRKRNKDGYATQCKICAEAKHKLKYATTEEYRKNRINKTTDSKRKTWYGVDRNQYQNLFSNQSGLCAICKVQLDGSRRGLIGHLDHCHTTKKVRGILCKDCNTGLDLYRDNETFLLSAIQYLRNNK